MSWSEFLIVFACCAVTILVCRVVPLFVLKGKELPKKVEKALGFIPPAAFAALVANDILTPGMFAEGLWPAALPFAAALVVVIVSVKWKNLTVSALVGVAAYLLFTLI